MHDTTALDPRTPVLVGVGQVEQRVEDPMEAIEPIELLAEAARAAAADAGAPALLGALDSIAVPCILTWTYPDAAAALATRIGADPRQTIATDPGGNYPQLLINRAAREIQEGIADVVLIGGAECGRTASRARKLGVPLPWRTQEPGPTPTLSHTDAHEMWHREEWVHQVIAPVTFYALFESAWRAANSWSVAEHRDRMAALWAGFSEVAAANPAAWIRRPHSPEEIATVSPANPMVSSPYPKLMCANASVDQGAAVLLCSVERARALGISPDRWVFPWVGTEAHEHWLVSTRDSLAEAPAIRFAGAAALELAGLGRDDLAHVDLYSCFPSAVQIAAAELGLGTDRPLTVTGGISFAGGPWNNYVTHSVAAMAERLRADAGSIGLVSANGGFLTKHAFGIYSTEPPGQPFRVADVQAQVDALPSREVAAGHAGPVTVEASTVTHAFGHPERAAFTTLTGDGRRALASSTEPELLALVEQEETAGRAAEIDAEGVLHLT